jgi:hypothetical protein
MRSSAENDRVNLLFQRSTPAAYPYPAYRKQLTTNIVVLACFALATIQILRKLPERKVSLEVPLNITKLTK